MLDRRVSELLDEVAARTSAPGGGATSALVVALAAALAAMAARFADRRVGDEAAGLARRADELRAEAGALAQADADAYGAYLAARRLPEDDPARPAAIAEATSRAADVPLRIAELGAAVVRLADELLERGNPTLTGDAFAARTLAAAAARSAARLVLINLGEVDDARVARARELMEL
jgi:methenyltetrahydrofolate cyclohydrolase